ncbi:hypothetical protein [Butyrivibrio sp. NC3005]|uniref:hypothetical protein n=1 Tax=Butyrivibrio sp. NC3005 TaxID=1280685 RepID=UPI00040C996D|nr:hypothetical protein [Butyrivibrio sp. NC3005]
MKKTVLKIIYVIIVFCVSLVVIGHFSNHQEVDRTAKMEEPTLPVLSFVDKDKEIDELHAYVTEMDINYMRGNIFPTGKNRELTFKMNLNGQEVSNLRFEVREVDGSSLVENSDITNVTSNSSKDFLTGTFKIKDLIDEDKEYALVILADRGEDTLRYYCRIVWSSEGDRLNFEDGLSFVKDFSAKTFDEEKLSELRKYLEPKSTADNSSFSHVNINSSLNLIGWKDLEVKKHTQPKVSILDLHKQTGSYLLQYDVELKGEAKGTYLVNEYFRIRHTKERIYLLDYDRTMNYYFSGEMDDISEGKINLKITRDSNVEMAESDGGSMLAFSTQNSLYSYNTIDKKIAFIFSFFDKDHFDNRSRFMNHAIQILKVDETGNVFFTVSGYMNRGKYEGKVGIAIYAFNASTNTVEEMAFLQSRQFEKIVIAYAKQLSAIGNSNHFYTILGSDMYSVDLTSREYVSLVDNIVNCDYKLSDDGANIAWQDAGKEGMKNISVMNLNNQSVSKVSASGDDLIILLGFMKKDLVYGIVKNKDIRNDQMGNPVYAMGEVLIQDSTGTILKRYKPDGCFVTSADVKTNQIVLNRVKYDKQTKMYVGTTSDQIMSTLQDDSGANQIVSVSSENSKNFCKISLKKGVESTDNVKLLTPSQTQYEGSREVVFDADTNEIDGTLFYVYDKGDVGMVTNNSAKALQLALENNGVVINNYNHYIWYSGNRLSSNQIMAITNAVANKNFTKEDSTAVCLKLILEFKGIRIDVDSLLKEGKSPQEILSTGLPNATILNLDGCDVNSMLYYLNQDIPVMVRLANGKSMLLIGYNSQNTVILDPSKSSAIVYKYGINDSQKLFTKNGNHFLTFIP